MRFVYSFKKIMHTTPTILQLLLRYLLLGINFKSKCFIHHVETSCFSYRQSNTDMKTFHFNELLHICPALLIGTNVKHINESQLIVSRLLFQDAQFLRDLIMDGEWTDVLEYLNPLRDNPAYKKVRLMIEKQRLQSVSL